jgi:CheY-like chemotaxis protein
VTRLVVLDDDPAILSLLRSYFSGLGWTVECHGDPGAALRRVDSGAPLDAVISDLHFTPARRAEGLEILARAREQFPAAALLLFTAAGEPRVRESGLRSGADDVLRKPAPLAALRDAALRAMKRP